MLPWGNLKCTISVPLAFYTQIDTKDGDLNYINIFDMLQDPFLGFIAYQTFKYMTTGKHRLKVIF